MCKYNYFWLIIPIVTIIALMTIGTIYDLQISVSLYDRDSVFGIIFDYAGELPLYLLFPFCLAICFVYYRSFISTKYIVLSYLSVVLCVISLYVFMQRFFHFIPTTINLLIALVLAFLLFYGFHFIKRDTLEKLYKFAIIALIVLCLSLLLNQLIKHLWGRYRFHNLYTADNLERFTPWYLPLGLNGNLSFPSGHASAATSLFLLIPLLKIFNAKKWVKILAIFLVSLFVTAVCVSRIVLGAHYLTDVTMGFALSFAILIIVQHYMFKYFSKKRMV